MISKEDYNFVMTLEKLTGKGRADFLSESRTQCARTFLNLLGHVSKDQTVQYLLVIIDDLFKACIAILTVLSLPPLSMIPYFETIDMKTVDFPRPPVL